MWEGQLISIHIADEGGAPTRSVNKIQAVPGKGLEGDRYFDSLGTFSAKNDGSRQVTLIEIEAIEALAHESDIQLSPGAARRNLVTRGVPLNHLVGRNFRIGEVTLRGIRLCEPCTHLAGLTEAGVLPGLVHRGGLRAEILTPGQLQVGDTIREY